MIVSKKAKLAFIHIPKNAGQSVVKTMSEKWPDSKCIGWGHCTLSQGRKLCRLKGYTTFAIIRDPWERMVSLYFYVLQKKPSYRTREGNRRPSKELKQLGFSKWLTQYGEMTNNVRFTETPQLSWITRRGKIIVDKIIRYENLAEGLAELGIKLKRHGHKTKHGHYSEYYDEKALDFIKRKFTPDIETFGYKYEDKHRN